MHKSENEVLLLPARQFKVVSCLNAGHGLNIIHVKEIDPPHPLLEPLPTSYPSPPTNPLHPIPQIKTSGAYRNPELEETIFRCSSHNINLKGQQLNDQDLDIVIKQAIIGKQCRKLDITYNEVTQVGASILADALRHNKYLEELNISHNSISDLGVRYLAFAINSSVLKRIHLTNNAISDEGATYLAEMLRTNTNLLQLLLNGNQIGNYGMNVLANTLTNCNTRLESLNLSANKDISDESIDSLVDMMEHNRSLKKLDLRYNNLSEDGEKRLHAVAKSKKGFELWLSHFM
jgi:Ran GTPase-activating protein (RanGAP) involved in mRNA processing and transport